LSNIILYSTRPRVYVVFRFAFLLFGKRIYYVYVPKTKTSSLRFPGKRTLSINRCAPRRYDENVGPIRRRRGEYYFFVTFRTYAKYKKQTTYVGDEETRTFVCVVSERNNEHTRASLAGRGVNDSCLARVTKKRTNARKNET